MAFPACKRFDFIGGISTRVANCEGSQLGEKPVAGQDLRPKPCQQQYPPCPRGVLSGTQSQGQGMASSSLSQSHYDGGKEAPKNRAPGKAMSRDREGGRRRSAAPLGCGATQKCLTPQSVTVDARDRQGSLPHFSTGRKTESQKYPAVESEPPGSIESCTRHSRQEKWATPHHHHHHHCCRPRVHNFPKQGQGKGLRSATCPVTCQGLPAGLQHSDLACLRLSTSRPPPAQGPSLFQVRTGGHAAVGAKQARPIWKGQPLWREWGGGVLPSELKGGGGLLHLMGLLVSVVSQEHSPHPNNT